MDEETDFVKTAALIEELQNDVTANQEKEMQEGMDVAEIREGMKCAGFLQAMPEVVHNDINDNTPIGAMRSFKEREQEWEGQHLSELGVGDE